MFYLYVTTDKLEETILTESQYNKQKPINLNQ